MAASTKRCKVCGKGYEYCRTLSNNIDVFRWQEVACSPACGAIYFNNILKSRGECTQDEPADLRHEEYDIFNDVNDESDDDESYDSVNEDAEEEPEIIK